MRQQFLLLVLVAALAAGLPTENQEAEATTPDLPEIEDIVDQVTEWLSAPSTMEPPMAPQPEDISLSNAITSGVSMINSSVHNEPACLRKGGNCLPKIECPLGSLSPQEGLCPNQKDLGVECCHGLSLLETRCRMRGGQCMSANLCSRALVEDRAEDCPDDKVCCVLVRS